MPKNTALFECSVQICVRKGASGRQVVSRFDLPGNTVDVQNPPLDMAKTPFTTVPFFESLPTGVGFCSSVFLRPLVQV